MGANFNEAAVYQLRKFRALGIRVLSAAVLQ